MTIACPRCGGPIIAHADTMLDPVRVTITLDSFSVRRHTPCFSNPDGDDGEPLPAPVHIAA